MSFPFFIFFVPLFACEVKPTGSGTELTITQSSNNEEKAKHSSENWAVVIDGMKKLIE